MHIVLALLVAAIVGYLLVRAWSGRSAPARAAPPGSRRGLAFLANGLLFYRAPGGDLQQLQSPFAQESQDRRERAKQRHGWKQGTAWGISARGGMRDFDPGQAPLQATAAAFEPSGDLLYFLRDDAVGGLFRRVAATGHELRLLLRQGLNLSDFALSPAGDTLAACSRDGATAHIVVVQTDGNGLREVTAGDTVDSAPAWVPGVPHRMLFQSSGLARNEQGYVVALGPASIQTLDMQTGTVAPVLDDPAFDHLRPRVCPQGRLHFIRRPHEGAGYKPENLLLDILLFPLRLLRAVFHYLNFFSLMYTRKPLTSANGPDMQADMKQILLQGRRIDAERALRTVRTEDGRPALVPASWQLVRRDAQGREEVLARHVSSFDISADGTVVYTNGRGVYVLEADGHEKLALTEPLVGEVVAAAA